MYGIKLEIEKKCIKLFLLLCEKSLAINMLDTIDYTFEIKKFISNAKFSKLNLLIVVIYYNQP